jgi:hypothetical protein
MIWGTSMALSWNDRGKSRETSVRVSRLWTKIWTHDFPNMRHNTHPLLRWEAYVTSESKQMDKHLEVKNDKLFLMCLNIIKSTKAQVYCKPNHSIYWLFEGFSFRTTRMMSREVKYSEVITLLRGGGDANIQ